MPVTRHVRVISLCVALLLIVPIISVAYFSIHLQPSAGASVALGDRANDTQASSRGGRVFAVAAPSATVSPTMLATAPTQIPIPTATTTPSAVPATATASPTLAPPTLTPTSTPIPRPTMPFTYTIKAGDTLWDLSIEFDTNVDSIIAANLALEEYPDTLLVGQPILIPPLVGAVHIVAPGDTLTSIAAYYKATVDAIVNYPGNLQKIDGPLPVGKVLLIPGGVKPPVYRWVSTEKGAVAVNIPAQKGMLSWPASGMITQWFSRYHLAIDVANRAGSPVLAAADGVVIFAGEKGGGFGNAVIIDHGDGYSTLSSHFQTISVAVGDAVTRGQFLGEMGCTGTCTGPHVHFALYYQGGAVNPLNYLP